MQKQLFLFRKATRKRLYMLVVLLTMCLFANETLFVINAAAQASDSQAPLGSVQPLDSQAPSGSAGLHGLVGPIAPQATSFTDSNQGPISIGPGVTMPVMTWHVPPGEYAVNVSFSASVGNNTLLTCDIAPSHMSQDFIIPDPDEDESGNLQLSDDVNLPRGGNIVLECRSSNPSPDPVQIEPGDINAAVSPR